MPWVSIASPKALMNPCGNAHEGSYGIPGVFGGWYTCGPGGEPVHVNEVSLDHIIVRSRRPDLVYEIANLQASCLEHNLARGSLSMEAWNARREAA